ncbi:rod shape-determining protein MreD [Metabacillus niabensis]|uniref:Rod shape-determining protein MreD n=1 Tax=Metabacillus niabensis TaxID=324854 RepID=A0ABT9YXJ9_9BACI|nr:rod shape-determining protein MreD [Metabacillus niabensis]MDQ0224713.1 rod shape-determining protein MreD [Metabacillus niabensis]
MRRFILPFLIFFVFISEGMFSHLVHFSFAQDGQLFVPRFVLIVIIFVTVYLTRTQGMLLGLVFGLLHDIVYIEVIGIYLITYALIAYLISKVMKVLHKNIFIVLFLTILSVALLEYYVYGVNYLIGATDMSMYNFTTLRLLPTLALNAVVAIIFIYPISRFLTKIKIEESED